MPPLPEGPPWIIALVGSLVAVGTSQMLVKIRLGFECLAAAILGASCGLFPERSVFRVLIRNSGCASWDVCARPMGIPAVVHQLSQTLEVHIAIVVSWIRS